MASNDAISCDIIADIYPNVTHDRRRRRGRRDILPFVVPAPEPIERWELVILVDDLPVQFSWERWADADANACAHPKHLIADPRNPGESGLVKLTSLRTGAEAFPLDPEQIAERFGPGRRGSGPRSRS